MRARGLGYVSRIAIFIENARLIQVLVRLLVEVFLRVEARTKASWWFRLLLVYHRLVLEVFLWHTDDGWLQSFALARVDTPFGEIESGIQLQAHFLCLAQATFQRRLFRNIC